MWLVLITLTTAEVLSSEGEGKEGDGGGRQSPDFSWCKCGAQEERLRVRILLRGSWP